MSAHLACPHGGEAMSERPSRKLHSPRTVWIVIRSWSLMDYVTGREHSRRIEPPHQHWRWISRDDHPFQCASQPLHETASDCDGSIIKFCLQRKHLNKNCTNIIMVTQSCQCFFLVWVVWQHPFPAQTPHITVISLQHAYMTIYIAQLHATIIVGFIYYALHVQS